MNLLLPLLWASTSGAIVKVWDGSTWVTATVKQWNGSSWVSATVAIQ